jgi:hypothetical protein
MAGKHGRKKFAGESKKVLFAVCHGTGHGKRWWENFPHKPKLNKASCLP